MLDGGHVDPVLACQADRGHLDVRVLQLLSDELGGFDRAFAVQVSGIAQFHFVVVNPEVHQLGGLAA